MGSVLLQWEREGKKQGVKDREIFESFLFFFFLLFLHAVVFSCISLIQIPASKRVPIILVLLRPTGEETGALLETLPAAVPGPLQMFASCCCSGAIEGRQLMQPCSAGLQCSAEGAGNATVISDFLIM